MIFDNRISPPEDKTQPIMCQCCGIYYDEVFMVEIDGWWYCEKCSEKKRRGGVNMTIEQNKKQFEITCARLSIMHDKKNADYGDAFTKLFAEYGLQYYIMHAEEKLMRIKQLSNNFAKVNESITDSLMDLASYSIMAIVELNRQEIIEGGKR